MQSNAFNRPINWGGLATATNINVGKTGTALTTTAAQLYGWVIHNHAAAPRYVRFYDLQALAILPASSVPKLVVVVPAASSVSFDSSCGIEFLTAIGYRASQLIADTDDTAPSANDVVANLFYKA